MTFLQCNFTWKWNYSPSTVKFDFIYFHTSKKSFLNLLLIQLIESFYFWAKRRMYWFLQWHLFFFILWTNFWVETSLIKSSIFRSVITYNRYSNRIIFWNSQWFFKSRGNTTDHWIKQLGFQHFVVPLIVHRKNVVSVRLNRFFAHRVLRYPY